ncbi:MAG: crossover junction endodeoxyribonuclease RuvC [Candidatus Krumholzibacteriia bacterium]|nr:crossover junction endodeoxyribonuclease RuvC [bacterium]MCB9515355.1 crossover junction endodeoxyribonuclease RuvC [Candidatus Latescibacterota bacterium]
MARILGIDPGIRRTGYGLIDDEGAGQRLVDAGVIAPSPDDELLARLLEIERSVEALLDRWRPDALAVENVFYHKNPQSTLTLGRAQAAVLLCAGRRGLPLALYSPSEVKQALTGSGRAAKEQVQFMVERILGRSFGGETQDLTDALAVALCHAGRRRSPLSLAALERG